MAGPCTRRSPCRNPPPAGKDELAGAPTDGSGTPAPTITPAVSRALTPAPAPTASAPASTDELFKQFMKTYLEAQTQTAQGQAEPQKQPLKAWFPNLYWGNLHMDCYRFCQQCEDHFKTAGAKKSNRIPFAASFLRGGVTQRWLQYKRRHDEAIPMTWPEFKDFLRKNLGDSRAFVDSI